MALKHGKTRFTFFFPDARILNEAEIAAIPAEKRAAVESETRAGIWLEINCPDASCVGDDGRITIPAVGAGTSAEEGTWLNLFCPKGSCEISQMTDLP